MKAIFSFRNLFLVVAVISSLLLTACGGGGGGGGGKNPGTSNITLSIDGSDLGIKSTSRADTDEDDSLLVKTTAYLKGSLKNDIKVEDRKATKSGSNYVCEIKGLVNGYDYRFSAYLNNGKKLMENQISSSELQNNPEIPVNVDTSIKTLAYDSWKSKSPSNASVSNFKKNCENAGLSKDEDFQQLYDPDAYKQSLAKIIKGDEASLPSKNNINTTEIATTDFEKPLTDIEKALIGRWYLNYSNKLHPLNPIGYDYSIEFKNNHTFAGYTPIYEGGSSISPQESIRVSKNARANLRFSNTIEEHIATGTWSYESGKLHLKYTDGNKKNDIEQVFSNVTVKNNTLTWTYSSDDGYSANEIFKKTKWSKPTEPASATKAIVGNWYLYSRNGEIVEQNPETERWEFKSDHTAKLPFEFTNGADKSSNQGTWYYDFGMIYIIPSWGNNNDELWIEIDFEKQSIISCSYEEEEGKEIVIIYKKTNSTQPSTITNKDLVGTWYLNFEDGIPVVPNSKGEVDTMTLKSDGTCTMKTFDLTNSGHSSYWEPEGTAYNDSGKWSYSNGKLTTTIDGYKMTVTATLKDGALTLTGTYEGSTETWTSVYKKTKYSK